MPTQWGMECGDQHLFLARRWCTGFVRLVLPGDVGVETFVEVAELNRTHAHGGKEAAVVANERDPLFVEWTAENVPYPRRLDVEAHVGFEQGGLEEPVLSYRLAPGFLLFNVFEECL